MGLRTNTIDKLGTRVDLLDEGDESSDLGVGGVQSVLVDVQPWPKSIMLSNRN